MKLLGGECDTIWKCAIPIADEFVLELPAGSIPLSVGWQSWNAAPVLWVAVNSATAGTEKHCFFLRGTGHPFPGLLSHRFIGTFQIERLRLVYHLFDGGPVGAER